MKLNRLTIHKFKGIEDFEIEPNGKDVTIRGENGTGKTTIADALAWVITGKGIDGSTIESQIKLRGADGNTPNDGGVEHTVEAELQDDQGNAVTVKKTYVEKWQKKRGDAENCFTGNTTLYSINDVPLSKTEFESRMSQICKQDNSLRFVCEELDENVIPFLLFNLAIRGIEADVIHGDVLKNEIYKVYTVRPCGKYSKVDSLTETDLQSYELGKHDAVISNAPYNISWEPPQNNGLFGGEDERFSRYDMPPKGNANFAFVLHCLYHAKAGGSVSMILPGGILSKDDGNSIRKQLVDNKIIDSVVIMPDKMFESTSISTCLLTLRQWREGIALVDARQTCHEEIRHQRGEGNKSHTNRIYHKALKAFTDEDIEKIVCAIEKRENVPEFSKAVTPEELAENNYSLAPSRYIEPESVKQICQFHRST